MLSAVNQSMPSHHPSGQSAEKAARVVSMRSAHAMDWPTVEALLREGRFAMEGARAHLPNTLVAECDGEIIGCASVSLYGEVAFLRCVIVRQPYRRSGIGRELVMETLRTCRENGVTKVMLNTFGQERFFERLGFREADPSATIQPFLAGPLRRSGAFPGTIMRREA